MLSVLVRATADPVRLCAAIDCVRRQTFTDWELVIVDEHASAATVSAIKRYTSDARIRMARFIDDLEEPSVGLEHSPAPLSRDFVSLLDADCQTEPRFERAIAHLRANSDLAAVGGASVVVLARAHQIAKSNDGGSPALVAWHALFGNPIACSTLTIRTNWFRALRPNDRERQWDDYDLIANAVGVARIAALPDIGVRDRKSNVEASQQQGDSSAEEHRAAAAHELLVRLLATEVTYDRRRDFDNRSVQVSTETVRALRLLGRDRCPERLADISAAATAIRRLVRVFATDSFRAQYPDQRAIRRDAAARLFALSGAAARRGSPTTSAQLLLSAVALASAGRWGVAEQPPGPGAATGAHSSDELSRRRAAGGPPSSRMSMPSEDWPAEPVSPAALRRTDRSVAPMPTTAEGAHQHLF